MPIADNKVHLIVSALGAYASGLGMHWAVEGNMTAGWQLALTIPAAVGHAALAVGLGATDGS